MSTFLLLLLGILFVDVAHGKAVTEKAASNETVQATGAPSGNFSIYNGKPAFNHRGCLEECGTTDGKVGEEKVEISDCRASCDTRVHKCMNRWCYGSYKRTYDAGQCKWWKQCYSKLCNTHEDQFEPGPEDCDAVQEDLEDNRDNVLEKATREPKYLYKSIYNGRPAFDHTECLETCRTSPPPKKKKRKQKGGKKGKGKTFLMEVVEAGDGEPEKGSKPVVTIASNHVKKCRENCKKEGEKCINWWCYGGYQDWFQAEQCDWFQQCFDKLCHASEDQLNRGPSCRRLLEQELGLVVEEDPLEGDLGEEGVGLEMETQMDLTNNLWKETWDDYML